MAAGQVPFRRKTIMRGYSLTRLAVWAVVFVIASSAVAAGPARVAPSTTVDFRYALPWWQTSICLPDDPEKPLVGKEGQFLFDYGTKGGPRRFAFSLAAGVEENSKWLRQETASAKAPIVRTAWDAGGVELSTEAFQVRSRPRGETQRCDRLIAMRCCSP